MKSQHINTVVWTISKRGLYTLRIPDASLQFSDSSNSGCKTTQITLFRVIRITLVPKQCHHSILEWEVTATIEHSTWQRKIRIRGSLLHKVICTVWIQIHRRTCLAHPQPRDRPNSLGNWFSLFDSCLYGSKLPLCYHILSRLCIIRTCSEFLFLLDFHYY